MKIINKKSLYMFNKEVYLLGINERGEKVFLEEPSWNCGWYWGFGYLETYTNNRCIEKSRDISSHSHYEKHDELYKLNQRHTLRSCVLNETEMKEFKKLMNQWVSINHYCKDEYINNTVLPEIFEKVLNLLIEEV